MTSTSAKPELTNPDEFAAIRPYEDSEVAQVIANLGNNKELLKVLLGFKFPKLAKTPLALPLSWLFAAKLKQNLNKIISIDDLQQQVKSYVRQMLATTSKGLEVTGLEQLDKNTSYLFISNHRDIAMDPALVNYALYTQGFNTVRIAIGDNLLRKDYVSDLMRLNKSFIVQRSAKGPRQKLAAFNLLSRYIQHSLKTDNQSIWIAQKEGRAKDGFDSTEAAIIKMFTMAQRKELAFNEIIAQLNLVPVAISYEYDPLAIEKANELVEVATKGEYAKTEFEDITSIAKGITGYKGRVKVAFGETLDNSFNTAEEVAAAIDEQLRQLYHLYPSNYLALDSLGLAEEIDLPKYDAATLAEFNQQLAACPEDLQEQWLKIYANPVRNFLNLDRL